VPRRSAVTLALLVAASMALLAVLTAFGPRTGPGRPGPALATLVIDFGGQRPAHPMGGASALWHLNGSVEASPGPAVWTIYLRLENESVYGALVRASRAANFTIDSLWYPAFGSHRVTGIAGVRDGQDGRYWQFWVNGAYASAGADLVPVHDGDLVTWGFRAPLQ